MALIYDFDIRWVLSEDSPAGSGVSGAGPGVTPRKGYVALFRDARTVEALAGADETLRRWLSASGFGFTVFDSGAGPGRYPARDEEARLDILGRLSANMKSANLKGAALNGFSMPAFLKAIVEAKPVGAPAQAAAPGAEARKPLPKPDIPDGSQGMDTTAPDTSVSAAGATPPMASASGPAFDIDAAFANPKLGAPVATADGHAPTVEDLLAGPLHAPVPAAPADGVQAAPEDLTYRRTVMTEAPRKRGMSNLPLLIVGGVVVAFFLFLVMGDAGGTGIVAR